MDDDKETEVDEEIEEKADEEAAKCRQVFDPIEKTFDYRKLRVTDLKENSRLLCPNLYQHQKWLV